MPIVSLSLPHYKQALAGSPSRATPSADVKECLAVVTKAVRKVQPRIARGRGPSLNLAG